MLGEKKQDLNSDPDQLWLYSGSIHSLVLTDSFEWREQWESMNNALLLLI